MTATSPAPSALEPPSDAPPDWDFVPFVVRCARCGRDLRGLREPCCPACGLEFAWAEAVPIHRLTCAECGYRLYGLLANRCPECGTAFTWAEALARYHRERNPLFEYRWRHEPVRSFVRAMWRSHRPGRFWRSLDLHDPPQVGPLLVMTVACLAACWLILVVGGGLVLWLWELLTTSQTSWPRARSWTAIPSVILAFLSEPFPYVLTVAVGCWLAASVAALLVFQQSMRRFRIRVAQVMRVWAYALVVKAPAALLILYACFVLLNVLLIGISSTTGPNVPLWRAAQHAEDLTLAGIGLLWGHALWSLRQGYAHYLRMPHSPGVAVASQIVAVLATLIVMAWLLLWR